MQGLDEIRAANEAATNAVGELPNLNDVREYAVDEQWNTRASPAPGDDEAGKLAATLENCVGVRFIDNQHSSNSRTATAAEHRLLIAALRTAPATSAPAGDGEAEKRDPTTWEGRHQDALYEIANRASNYGDDDAAEWMPSIYRIACEATGEKITPEEEARLVAALEDHTSRRRALPPQLPKPAPGTRHPHQSPCGDSAFQFLNKYVRKGGYEPMDFAALWRDLSAWLEQIAAAHPQPTGDVGELVERLRSAAQDKALDIGAAWSLIDEAADALASIDRENFALAADQCHDGYAGEHGDHRCHEVDAQRQRAEAAEARVAELEKALEPFAELSDRIMKDGGPLLGEYLKIEIRRITWNGEHDVKPADLRRARAALSPTEAGEDGE